MPPPLDINLHVKYIQNLDQVRPLLFSALSSRELADENRKKTWRIILQNIYG